IVAKVENRATRKISRKLIFGLLRRCVAFQGRHGGPWSILDETMWSLTPPLAKRISGAKKFRLSPQRDFCNNICQFRKSPSYSTTSSACPISDAGRVTPRVFAVLRFTANSKRIGCCTGSSLGFVPLRILATYPADRRY